MGINYKLFKKGVSVEQGIEDGKLFNTILTEKGCLTQEEI